MILRILDIGKPFESIDYASLHYQQTKYGVPTMTEETANKARRMGRPRTGPKTARRNRVVTLVTDSEFKELRATADATGQSVSALVHQIVSRFLKRRK